MKLRTGRCFDKGRLRLVAAFLTAGILATFLAAVRIYPRPILTVPGQGLRHDLLATTRPILTVPGQGLRHDLLATTRPPAAHDTELRHNLSSKPGPQQQVIVESASNGHKRQDFENKHVQDQRAGLWNASWPATGENSIRLAFAATACGNAYCDLLFVTVRTFAAQLAIDRAHGATILPRRGYVVVDSACQNKIKNRRPHLLKHVNKTMFDLTYIHIDEIKAIPGSELDMFKPCAAARLYLPRLLPDVDIVLYLDTDVVVSGSMSWLFHRMVTTERSVLYMAEEVESSNCPPRGACGHYHSWYELQSIMAGKNGVNSGVCGMDLRRWRSLGLDSQVAEIQKKAKQKKLMLRLGDQDVLNYLIRRNGSLLHLMPCQFNLRADSRCCQHNRTPIMPQFLHGSHGIFWQILGGSSSWMRGRYKLAKAANAALARSEVLAKASNLWQLASLRVDDFVQLADFLHPNWGHCY